MLEKALLLGGGYALFAKSACVCGFCRPSCFSQMVHVLLVKGGHASVTKTFVRLRNMLCASAPLLKCRFSETGREAGTHEPLFASFSALRTTDEALLADPTSWHSRQPETLPGRCTAKLGTSSKWGTELPLTPQQETKTQSSGPSSQSKEGTQSAIYSTRLPNSSGIAFQAKK